jgi:hypothetical protein
MGAYEEYYKDKCERLEKEKELLEEKIKSLMVIIDGADELKAKIVIELCGESNELKRRLLEQFEQHLKVIEKYQEVLKKCSPVRRTIVGYDWSCSLCGHDSGHAEDCKWVELCGNA